MPLNRRQNHRPLPPPHQPPNPCQIHNPHQRAIESTIIRVPRPARPVINRHRNHAAPRPQKQCRQIAMHVIKRRQPQKRLALKNLQSAPGIRCGIAQNRRPQPISEARRKSFHPAVAARHPVPRDQHRPATRQSLRLRAQKHRRNIGGIILPITIECGDPLTTRRAHPAHHRRRLPATLRMAHRTHAIGALRGLQLSQTIVTTAVIHIQNLVFHTRKCPINLAAQQQNVPQFIFYRHNHRNTWNIG